MQQAQRRASGESPGKATGSGLQRYGRSVQRAADSGLSSLYLKILPMRAAMSSPQPVRGTQSLIGEEVDRFHAVIAAFDRVRRLFGFKRVEVPVIEHTEVFARSIGETTDVVSKEMYTFEDRGGESITLRPEFTAGICRAYLSEGWQQFAPLKLATHGPAFR
jgi:histidyl-tRNA synthetase